MSYSVENVDGCTKKIVFNFETVDLTAEIKAAVTRKQKDVNLKGFRKGKAPLSMVEQMYGPQIESDALNSFVQTQFFEAVNTENLRVVGYPNFENMKYEKGKSVSFDALVEVFPEVQLKDYTSYSFEKESVEVTDEDVNKLRDNYLGQKSEMVEVKDKDVALDKGLFAVLNFEGEKADGEKPENMKGEEFLLEIGSNQFIPGFEDGLVGMKAGEKKTLELTFPEDYHAEDLKGAKVKFHTEILEIKEKKVPEFTDELAKEFGFDSVEDFNTKNKDMLVNQKDRAAKEKLHQAILEKFVEENKFDVPKALVTQQQKYLKDDLTGNLKQQGFTDEMVQEYFTKWADDLVTKAEFQVRSGLILDTLANKFEIEASDSDLEAKLEETAKSSGLSVDQLKEYYSSNEQIKKNMMYAIREEKTFAKLTSEMKVK